MTRGRGLVPVESQGPPGDDAGRAFFVHRLRLLALMLAGAMLVGAMFAPAVQHGRPSEAHAWWTIFGAVAGALLGALAHFRLRTRR